MQKVDTKLKKGGFWKVEKSWKKVGKKLGKSWGKIGNMLGTCWEQVEKKIKNLKKLKKSWKKVGHICLNKIGYY